MLLLAAVLLAVCTSVSTYAPPADENLPVQDVDMKEQLKGAWITNTLAQQNMAIEHEQISASPDLNLRLGSQTTDLSGRAELHFNRLSVTDTAKQLVLLAVESLDVSGINLEALGKANVAGITFKGTRLIQKDGSSEAPAATVDAQTPDPAAAEAVNETAAPAVRFDELTIQEHSDFSFIDRSGEPPYQARVDLASVRVKDVDSSKPDQPITVEVKGRINDYGNLEVSGSVKPFAEQPDVDISPKVNGQSMSDLSSYLNLPPAMRSKPARWISTRRSSSTKATSMPGTSCF